MIMNRTEPSIKNESMVEIVDKGARRLVCMTDYPDDVRDKGNPTANKGAFYVVSVHGEGERAEIEHGEFMAGPFETRDAARDWALRDHLPYGASLTDSATYGILELTELFTIRMQPARAVLEY